MNHLLILLFAVSAFAQTDSTKITASEETVAKFEKTTLIDEYEKAFGGNRIVKSALRYCFKDAGIQYEQKIGIDKSLLIGAIGGWGSLQGITLRPSTEFRWYYDMKHRVDAGIQNPNITGKYWSISLSHVLGKPNWINNRNPYMRVGASFNIFKWNGIYSYPRASLNLNYGRQFGNNADYAFSFGLVSELQPKANFDLQTVYSPVLSTRSSIAWGLYFPRKRQISPNTCDFLGCHYEVKRLFKINLNDAFYLSRFRQVLVGDVAFEQKIGKLPISLNSNLILGFANQRGWQVKEYRDTTIQSKQGQHSFYLPIFSDIKTNRYGYLLQINEQLRYYVGMGRRVAKGKTANNLNGFYVGLQGGYLLENTRIPELPLVGTGFYNFQGQFIRMGLTTGYQTQTNRKSFVDVGLTFLRGFDLRNSAYNGSNTWIDLHTKIGLAR